MPPEKGLGEDFIRSILGLHQQAAAGVVEQVMPPNSGNAVENAIPGAAYGLYGILGAGPHLLDKHLADSALGIPPAPYSLRALEMAGSSVNRTNEAFGIKEPSNTLETATRVLGGLLLPTPKFMQFTPKPGGNAVVNTLKRGANLATETVLPLRQSDSVGTVLTSAGIATGLAEGLNAGNPNYTSAYEAVTGTADAPDPTSADAVQPVAGNDDFLKWLEGQGFAPVTQEKPFEVGADASAIEGAVLEKDSVPQLPDWLNDALNVEKMEALADEEAKIGEDGNSSMYWAAGGAVLGAAFGARYLLKRFHAQQGMNRPTVLTGSQVPSTFSSATSRLKQGLVDRTATLTDAIEKAASPNAAMNLAEEYAAFAATNITGQALQARTSYAMLRGKLPDSAIRIPKIAKLMHHVGKLDPRQRDILDDALVARDMLSRPGVIKAGNWEGKSLGELRALKALGDQDPALRRIMAEHDRFYNRMVHYMHEQGIISAKQLNTWSTRYPHYTPNIADWRSADGLFAKLGFDEADRQMFFAGMPEYLNTRKWGTTPNNHIRPTQVMEGYLQGMIRYVEVNTARKKFIDAIDFSTPAGGLLGKFINRIKSPSARRSDNSTLIPVHRGGKLVYYEIDDPGIAHALKFEPLASAGRIIGGMRGIFQFFNTGPGNIGFVPLSWMYEMGSGLLTSHTAVTSSKAASKYYRPGLTMVDEILQQSGLANAHPGTARWLSALGRPTVALSPITGTIRGIASDAVLGLSEGIYRGLDHPNSLTARIAAAMPNGQARLRSIAQAASDAYDNSVKRIVDEYGGMRAVAEDFGDFERFRTALPTLSAEFDSSLRATSLGRPLVRRLKAAYMSVLHNMHNAVRLQYVAANLKKGMTPKQQEHLVAMARKLGGDVTQSGSNRPYRIYQDATPYMNVGVQVAARHAEALRANPLQYAANLGGYVLGGAALLAMQFEDNPEAAKRYWNMTPDERAKYIPIFDEKGDVVFNISNEQLLQPIWSMFAETWGTLSGSKAHYATDVNNPDMVPAALSFTEMFNNAVAGSWEWDETNIRDFLEGQKAGVSRALPGMVPQIADVGAAAFGKSLDIGRMTEGQSGLRDLATERVTADQDSRTVQGMNVIAQEMLQGLLGVVSRSIIEGYEGFASVDTHYQSMADDVAFKTTVNRFMAPYADQFPYKGDMNYIEPGIFSQSIDGPMHPRVRARDTNTLLAREKLQGLEQLNNQFSKAFAGAELGTTGRSFNSPTVGAALLPNDRVPQGSALMFVMDRAIPLMRQYNKFIKPEIAQIQATIDVARYEPAYAADPVGLRKLENRLMMERRLKYTEALQILHAEEQMIEQALGIEFSFDDYDAEELKKLPYPQVNQ